ncbi:VOC family protein [Paenibacillus nasutitermitis]|uniref:VOC domain-containing protein n=1 Tax=Paenibacillus nasutitermitis TaxID=1652958 RepID=A0A916Z723_9BACL|nr:VOC family protein [Paenibacillus nasutitermitis]GGD79868.1 hypothetical protein GCM10010911_42470 [Paenibacillus nasutitermitis]
MVNRAIEEFAELTANEVVPPSVPVLKRVNCIYVPASDPYLTIKWFERHFGLRHPKEVKKDTNGESLELGNGMELFILRAEKGSRMTFQTDVWSGPNFQMSMLSFEVDNIVDLHQKLLESGEVKLEELRDNDGCGIGFYFYDPDGNKFTAWELQTMVWRKAEVPAATRLEERFGFVNCYFHGELSGFIARVREGSRDVSRRIQIIGCSELRQSDREGLQQLVETFEKLNREYPDRPLRIVYRE